MTAFASRPATYRPYLPTFGEGTVETLRAPLRRWRLAFASAHSRRADLDSATLLISARD